MATHVRCGTLFTGTEDTERRAQTLVIDAEQPVVAPPDGQIEPAAVSPAAVRAESTSLAAD